MSIRQRCKLLSMAVIVSAALWGSIGARASVQGAEPIPWPTVYKHVAAIPAIGTPSGIYMGEFRSGDMPNTPVDPAKLPNRPFVGTELYYEDNGATGEQEADWFRQLDLDFLRVEVDADEIISPKRTSSLLPNDFTEWTADDFESGKGWRFNAPDTSVTNILQNSYGVEFPLMLMMHYGAESFMGQIPNSASYADYFLATVYYYNVVRGMNIKYWEVLNEPDWGYGDPAQVVSPTQYAAIFKRVAERIKNFPDARVNSIALGGPVLGSGDPIDGKWPDGYPNRDSDGERHLRDYIPKLLAQGSRDGQQDVGFLSWHIYGAEHWGRPNNIYELDQNYAIINQIDAYYKLGANYTGDKAGLPLVISEMNFAAGETDAEAKAYYKNFYAALWHTSTLNNIFSTGHVALLSHFYWKGNDHWPKGLVYKDADSGDQLVRNTVWWAYREYMQHTQNKVLAASNSKRDPWVDALVTTDERGKMLFLIAVNKSGQPKAIDFSFNVPDSLTGQVAISKRTMTKSGTGTFGAAFAEPTIKDVYQFQPVNLVATQQLRYAETLPPRSIVYYTVVAVP